MADGYFYNGYLFNLLINRLQMTQDKLLEASSSLEQLLVDIQADESWINMNKTEVTAFLELINMVNKDLFGQNEEGSESAVQDMLKVLRNQRDTMYNFYETSPAFATIKENTTVNPAKTCEMDYVTWPGRRFTTHNVLANWLAISELNDLINEANDYLKENDGMISAIDYDYADMTQKINDAQFEQGTHLNYVDNVSQEFYDVDEMFAKEVSNGPLERIDGIDISEYSVEALMVTNDKKVVAYKVSDFITGIQLDNTDKPKISTIEMEVITQSLGFLVMNKESDTLQQYAISILSRDYETWDNQEAEVIGTIMVYAMTNNDVELMEIIVEGLHSCTYTINTTGGISENEKWSCAYQMKPKSDAINEIMLKLKSGKDEGVEGYGEVYSTLNRINSVVYQEYQIESDTEMGIYRGTMDISVSMVDGRMQLEINSGVDGETKYKSNIFTIYDMAEVIGLEEENFLIEVGYTPEEVESLRMSAITDGDILFVDKLTNQNYEEAFNIETHCLSQPMCDRLVDYIIQLEESDETEELQEMINGILNTDIENNLRSHNTRGHYLDIIQLGLVEQIDNQNAHIKTLEASNPREQLKMEQEVARQTDPIYKQLGLWMAIDNVYEYEMGVDNYFFSAIPFADGYVHAEIFDLIDSVDLQENEQGKCGEPAEGYYRFKIKFLESVQDENSKSFEEVLEGGYIQVSTFLVEGATLESANNRIEISKLREQKQFAEFWPNIATDVTANITDEGIPFFSKGTLLMRAVINNDEKILNTIINKNPYIEQQKSNYEKITGVEVGNLEWNDLLEAFCGTYELDENLNEKQRKMWYSTYTQGVGVKFALCNADGNIVMVNNEAVGKEYVLGTDVILPQTAANINKIEETGIEPYIRQNGYIGNADNMKQLLMDIEHNITAPSDVEQVILYGGKNIMSLPVEEVSECIQALDAELQRRGLSDGDDFAQWIRGVLGGK